MRVTVSISDDVLDSARALADAEHISLGTALSTLARRGIPKVGLRIAADGMPVIDVPGDFPPITGADVTRALADFR